MFWCCFCAFLFFSFFFFFGGGGGVPIISNALAHTEHHILGSRCSAASFFPRLPAALLLIAEVLPEHYKGCRVA